MRNKLMLGILSVILLAGLVVGAGGYLSQEQLDAINVSNLNHQTLQCVVFGEPPYIYYHNGDLRTYFTCFEVEKHGEDKYYYHNNSYYWTTIHANYIWNIYQDTNYSYAKYVYWELAKRQGIEHVNNIKRTVLNYQTYDSDFWQDFEGGMW